MPDRAPQGVQQAELVMEVGQMKCGLAHRLRQGIAILSVHMRQHPEVRRGQLVLVAAEGPAQAGRDDGEAQPRRRAVELQRKRRARRQPHEARQQPVRLLALRAAELLELPQAQAGVAQADAQHRPRRQAGRRTGLQAQRQPSRHRLRLLIRRRFGQQGLKRLPMFRADQRAHRPPRLQSGAEQLRRPGVEAAHQAVAVVHQDGGIGHERSQQVRGHGGGHENRNRVEKMKDVAERESGGSLAWMPGDLSRIARGQA